MSVVVELCKSVEVVPDSLAVGMEDVWSFGVDHYAFDAFGVAVSGDVFVFVDDEGRFAGFCDLLGECSSEET